MAFDSGFLFFALLCAGLPGSLFVLGGIYVIRRKRIILLSKRLSGARWMKPYSKKGRWAVFAGAHYVVGGSILLLIFLASLVAMIIR